MKTKLLFVLFLMLAMLFAASCNIGGNQTGAGNNQGQQNGSENTEGGFDRTKVSFLSAYSEAKKLGFEGTLEEFVALISGKDGADGNGISTIVVNQEGHLIVLMTNGTSVDCGVVVGADGKDGKTPTVEISSDGYWVIDGIKTEFKAGYDEDVENPQGLEFYLKNDGTYAVSIGKAKYLTEIVIPSMYCGKAVTEIADVGFCPSSIQIEMESYYPLTSIKIPNSVTRIGVGAFAYCKNLVNVQIENSIQEIGEFAFQHCSALEQIRIPSSVTKIEAYAFDSCSSLGSIYFQKTKKWSYVDNNEQLSVEIPSSSLADEATAARLLTDELAEYDWVFFDEFAVAYPWENTTLIFQMSDNSNRNELSSGAKRYLAGETYDAEEIDKFVDKRNALAEQNTKVDVTYVYWPDDSDYGWGKNIDRIHSVSTSDSSSPDIYSVFVYDMVGSMLRGCFENTLGDSNGTNYFRYTADDYNPTVDEEGYMYEYMTSLTLSKKKMYLIASDYFVDVVRAFFVVPVNIKLLTDNAKDVTIAATGSGTGSYADFIKLVEDRKWNYELLKAYCDEVATENENGTLDLDGIVGFALSSYSSISSAGLLYTTPITIIERKGNSLTGYRYSYPETNAALTDFCVKLDDLMKSNGAYVLNGSLDTIRQAFANNHVLFGGVICVGSLENEVYQKMRGGNNGGFGVVPVPLYSATYTDKDGEVVDTPYLTQIHNLGRVGAIARDTTKFSQCTAFLNYVSTNSTEILDEYYEWKLSVADVYGTAAGTNEKMLKMIRTNVGSAFDKVFEDALGIYGNLRGDLYHDIIRNGKMTAAVTGVSPYQVGEDMTMIYQALYSTRVNALAALVAKFEDSTSTD